MYIYIISIYLATKYTRLHYCCFGHFAVVCPILDDDPNRPMFVTGGVQKDKPLFFHSCEWGWVRPHLQGMNIH